jgi:hypothetical protein
LVLDGLTGNIIWEVTGINGGAYVTGDINGDGEDDVITATGEDLYIFDGRNGNLICKSENKHYAIASVIDIDNDGILDIIAGGGDEISAYRGLGRYLRPPQWPQFGHDLLNSNNFETKLIY